MNTLETLNEKDLKILSIRRLNVFVTVTQIIYFILYSIVFNPLYTFFTSNVLYQNLWWVNLLGIFCDILDPILFVIVYPTTLYALWHGGVAGLKVAGTFSVLTFLKFILNYWCGWVFSIGALPNPDAVWDELVNGMALNLFLMYILEMVQYWLIIGLFFLFIKLSQNRENKKNALQAVEGNEPTETEYMPLIRLFNKDNPVQLTLFVTSIWVTVIRIIMHIVYQMTLIVYVGMPDDSIQFAADMISDVLFGVIMYMAGILLMNALYKKKK